MSSNFSDYIKDAIYASIASIFLKRDRKLHALRDYGPGRNFGLIRLDVRRADELAPLELAIDQRVELPAALPGRTNSHLWSGAAFDQGVAGALEGREGLDPRQDREESARLAGRFD